MRILFLPLGVVTMSLSVVDDCFGVVITSVDLGETDVGRLDVAEKYNCTKLGNY